MSDKELVLEAVRELPNEASFDEIIDRIMLEIAIRRGQEAIERGEVVSHEEVKKRIARWNSN